MIPTDRIEEAKKMISILQESYPFAHDLIKQSQGQQALTTALEILEKYEKLKAENTRLKSILDKVNVERGLDFRYDPMRDVFYNQMGDVYSRHS